MIDWPTLTLPPINLYNAPRQPVLAEAAPIAAASCGIAPAVSRLLALRSTAAPLATFAART